MAVTTRNADGEPIVEDCNRLFLETLGYERAQVVGEPLESFYTTGSTTKLLDEGGYTRALSAEFTREERALLTADGETRETLLRAVPRKDEMGETVGTLALFVDISERKRLERENERLDAFTSVVSHDLRNPLNVIDFRAELAREECDSEHLDDITRAVDRMEALIDDLLSLARHGEAVTEVETIPLDRIAEHCWQNIESQRGTLRIDTDTVVRADESRLQQVLENLFRNAVEHGDGDVTVRVGGMDGGFYVADDGPGIPEADRETVFEHGYSTADEGTGFGLAIVQEIVVAHGWTISVTDSADGGARFEITGVETVQ